MRLDVPIRPLRLPTGHSGVLVTGRCVRPRRSDLVYSLATKWHIAETLRSVPISGGPRGSVAPASLSAHPPCRLSGAEPKDPPPICRPPPRSSNPAAGVRAQEAQYFAIEIIQIILSICLIVYNWCFCPFLINPNAQVPWSTRRLGFLPAEGAAALFALMEPARRYRPTDPHRVSGSANDPVSVRAQLTTVRILSLPRKTHRLQVSC